MTGVRVGPDQPTIFLDVDGVLNHSGCPEWEQGDHRVLDPDCVSRIRGICERTGARIVVSSTWRLGDGMQRLREAFGALIVGETPYLEGRSGSLYTHVARRDEIAAWIEAHPNTGPICIVDDDWDAAILGAPFVKTSHEGGGLTEKRAAQIEKFLGVRVGEPYLP